MREQAALCPPALIANWSCSRCKAGLFADPSSDLDVVLALDDNLLGIIGTDHARGWIIVVIRGTVASSIVVSGGLAPPCQTNKNRACLHRSLASANPTPGPRSAACLAPPHPNLSRLCPAVAPTQPRSHTPTLPRSHAPTLPSSARTGSLTLRRGRSPSTAPGGRRDQRSTPASTKPGPNSGQT